jgi:hypothetical protein
MAGILVPTVFVLVTFVFFCVARFGYRGDLPIERVIVFPMALVPSLWGIWNMVYVALHDRRRLPLGFHGALLPTVLLPLAFVVAQALNAGLPGYFVSAFWMVLPGLVIIYYLVWKYLVGFFNRMLGIA